ncbi:polyprenol phosphomannose-dependent alpha 1,6 mannosyltransferase MptB [Aciditerrimonas ferrireducens]|uniref:Polyprenol phosphomannose-dependent alpha 1,6 mannosyltransferase MptB n=1 Tax=Aciditerrimonas ferrireducens TaxID=667306 RepID=A0ABV6C135_9ACTN
MARGAEEEDRGSVVAGRSGAEAEGLGIQEPGFSRWLPAWLDRSLDRVTAWDTAMRSRWPFKAIVGPEIDPAQVEGSGARLLVRPALLGLVGLCAIAAGASQPSSPFALKLPGSWFFGVPSPGSHPSTTGLFLGLVAVYGGLLLLMRAWFSMARTLATVPGVPVRAVGWVLVLWCLPMLVAPPVFSHDVYAYAAQGEMMSRHIDPYRFGPNVLGIGAPFQRLVDPIWGNAPAPYGPLFLLVDGWLVSLSGHHELLAIVLLRLVELLGVAMIAVGVPDLARSYGKDPATAFTLGVLNPIVILYLVGSAHNDALMVGFLVLGIAAYRRDRPLLGVLLCALGTAIKAPAALGCLYIGWTWLGPNATWKQRIRPVVLAGVVSVLVVQATAEIAGLGWGWVANLDTPGTVTSWLAPATGVGLLLTHVVHGLGISVAGTVIRSLTRVLGLALAGGVGLWLLWHYQRFGILRAMGATLVLVVALGPVVQPWYLSWGFVVLAPIASTRLRPWLAGLSMATAFIGLPGGRQLLGELPSHPASMAIALLALLFILTVPLTPLGRGAGPEGPDGVPGREDEELATT